MSRQCVLFVMLTIEIFETVRDTAKLKWTKQFDNQMINKLKDPNLKFTVVSLLKKAVLDSNFLYFTAFCVFVITDRNKL